MQWVEPGPRRFQPTGWQQAFLGTVEPGREGKGGAGTRQMEGREAERVARMARTRGAAASQPSRGRAGGTEARR